MIGFPHELRTKQDYLNAADYARRTGEGRELLAARLRQIKATRTYMGLRDEAYAMPAEKQHQENYEPKPDPNCAMERLGFTEAELDALLGGLQDV